jgi:hypothetical protein
MSSHIKPKKNIYSTEEERHEARKQSMMKCYWKRRQKEEEERIKAGSPSPKIGRKMKYANEEERKSAIRRQKREYNQRHKKPKNV